MNPGGRAVFFVALLLGVLEGVTEFVPVSSTGHLILVSTFLGLDGPANKLFDIVIQLGAILAVCWLYRAKLMVTTMGMAKLSPKDWRFATSILIGFAPSMVLGALFHALIKDRLFNPTVVSAALIGGGLALLLVERVKPCPRLHNLDTLPLPVCLMIGLFQCLSMVPGTSRSGATIIGAMTLGVDRKVAAEYSFFLAIPTMVAATTYDLYQARQKLTSDGTTIIAIGFAAAFVSALVVVRGFITYCSKHGFVPFGWYRIVLGIAMLAILTLR